MKKNTVKAFTLVEMLIVIVIIGILIASLMPRMQSAQWRARDVARKNDLSQIQTAIITSQQDKWKWPMLDSGAKTWMPIGGDASTNGAQLAQALVDAWMTQVPTDPNGSNVVIGLWSTGLEMWKYGYMVTTRNSVADGWFVLMAKTEVEWSSNWVVCGDDAKSGYGTFTGNWVFAEGNDLKHVVTCTEFDKGTECYMENNGKCHYTDEWQLAYILVY